MLGDGTVKLVRQCVESKGRRVICQSGRRLKVFKLHEIQYGMSRSFPMRTGKNLMSLSLSFFLSFACSLYNTFKNKILLIAMIITMPNIVCCFQQRLYITLHYTIWYINLLDILNMTVTLYIWKSTWSNHLQTWRSLQGCHYKTTYFSQW